MLAVMLATLTRWTTTAPSDGDQKRTGCAVLPQMGGLLGGSKRTPINRRVMD